MKNDRISEKILLGACRILLEWERTYANLDECIDQMRTGQTEGRSAIASLLFEYFRHKDFIDRMITERARKGAVKAELRVLLACALTQSIFQTGIASQSAANIAVDCAKHKFGPGPGSFVNAVMRSALQSSEAADPPGRSFPVVLKQHWEEIFGEETTAELMETYASNPPPVCRLRGKLPSGVDPALFKEIRGLDFTGPFRFFELTDPEKFFRLGLLEKGLAYVQDPATALPFSLLEAAPEGKILDACAAPGGKTILCSDLAADKPVRITAADRSPQRLQTLKINLNRTGVKAAVVRASAQENSFADHSFDLILADVPCGNSGVIRRRCDAPWRYSERKLLETATLQWDILNSLSRLVQPGGGLLYSTCSIEPEEDEQQITRFLTAHPDFRLIRQRKLLPGKYHDGAFAALLRSEPSSKNH